MKLDPRIIEGKKPLTCFDTEIAKRFIGKECFFTNDIIAFSHCFSALHKGNLSCIDDEPKPFKSYSTNGSGRVLASNFILPLEWVKEEKPKKKYRSYKDYDELCEDFSVGQCITYRDKGCNCIHHAEIVEAFVHTDGDVFVGIGNAVRALSGWFQTIEVKDPETDTWVPFGVKV